jgi:hypothetical protein
MYIDYIVQFTGFLGTFMALDQGLSIICHNPFYLVHAIHNGFIVYYTLPDVVNTITNYKYLHTYPTNMTAILLCFALHIYHTILYYKKFRYDDWLHHILMICFALPIPLIYESHTLIGYSLFFTTGLPGGIDYALLFAVRNNLLNKMTEKKINSWLNTWIRSPGCISNALIVTISLFGQNINPLSFEFLIKLMPGLLVFWNGQYFMRQVVEDYAVQHYQLMNQEE